jgi:peroxiredoxin Q/BCP
MAVRLIPTKDMAAQGDFSCVVQQFWLQRWQAGSFPCWRSRPALRRLTWRRLERKPVSLSDYKGKWVVLYFYPKDQTSGCSKEAHKFQDDQDKYKALHAVVLGVSLDTVESHATWCTKDGFSFKMLADPEHKVVDLYGVPVRTVQTPNGPMTIAMRDTFLISPSGKIVKEWEVKDIDNHSDEVLAAIKADGK